MPTLQIHYKKTSEVEMWSVDVPGDNSCDLDVSLNRIMAAEILIQIICRI